MSEPFSTGAGGFAVAKAIPVLGPVLATIIVMCLATPKSKRELLAALTSTVTLSIFGGSIVVNHLNWAVWADSTIGLMGIAGVFFMCGLPGWLIVRALFAYMEKRKNSDIVQIVNEVSKSIQGKDTK